MRFLLLLCVFAATAGAAPSPPASEATDALRAALVTFRTDGPKGWSFTQTTSGDGHSRVERFDAAQPEFARWTLVQEDGHAPTADQLADYHEKLSRHSAGGTAPRLTDQFDLATLEVLSETGDRSTYRCRLKTGESGDATAGFLHVTLVLHRPTQTIETLELGSREPFSPTFAVKIAEMKTTMSYSLPEGDRPSLLQRSTTRLRGRAFWVKSLDADLTVEFTDYVKATRAPR